MRVVHYITYLMSFMFIAGETSRRGLGYFSINATTMLEDYLAGLLLLTAAVLWTKHHPQGKKFMIAAWAYATGGMFVPFFAHLEAYTRGVTFRTDHPHEDLNSVILKGIIWGTCLICFIVVMRSTERQTT